MEKGEFMQLCMDKTSKSLELLHRIIHKCLLIVGMLE